MWIRSFCSDRKASVVVDDYESAVQDNKHAGIAQGSPLSPLLYIFCNANLVQSRLNKGGGSVGFIDDYNAWVIGPSAETNTGQATGALDPETRTVSTREWCSVPS